MTQHTRSIREITRIHRTNRVFDRCLTRLHRTVMVCTVGCVLIATGCLHPLNVRVIEIDPNGWQNPVTVTYDNQDTLYERTLYATARFRNDFGYDRLTLAITTTTPEGYKWHDTVTIQVFDETPETSLFLDREQPLRTSTMFTHPGCYRFTFSPVMPDGRVEGVVALGIDIR